MPENINQELSELQAEVEELQETNGQLRNALRHCADLVAEAGEIHNTPHAKFIWVNNL